MLGWLVNNTLGRESSDFLREPREISCDSRYVDLKNRYAKIEKFFLKKVLVPNHGYFPPGFCQMFEWLNLSYMDKFKLINWICVENYDFETIYMFINCFSNKIRTMHVGKWGNSLWSLIKIYLRICTWVVCCWKILFIAFFNLQCTLFIYFDINVVLMHNLNWNGVYELLHYITIKCL